MNTKVGYLGRCLRYLSRAGRRDKAASIYKTKPTESAKPQSLKMNQTQCLVYTTMPLCAHPFRPFHAHSTSPHAIHTLTAMAQNVAA